MAKKEMIKSFVLRVDAETMEAMRKSGRMKKKKTIIKKEEKE